MKRIRIIIYAAVILIALSACEFAGITIDFGGGSDSGGASAGTTVEAGIDSPASGASLPMGEIDISYHASSSDGVAAVELSINGEVVNSVATPGSEQKVVALEYTWKPEVSGSHTIRVRAQNNAGSWSDYSAATVSVTGGQQEEVVQVPAEPKEPEATKTPKPTATPDKITLFDIKHDKDTFYYGNNTCGSHEITISARVTNPDDVFQVVIFTRFADRESAGFTKWDSGHAMSKKSDDLYSITLTSTKITNYNAYEFAVMRYQLVVQDKDGNRDVRTEVLEDILLEVCTS
jgi:hypothetical protein